MSTWVAFNPRTTGWFQSRPGPGKVGTSPASVFPLLRWQAVVDEGTMMIVPEACPHDGKTTESYHPLVIRGRVVAENTA